MCKLVEETLGVSMEAFAETEARTVAILQNEADDASEQAESSLAKYLHRRQTYVEEEDEAKQVRQGGLRGLKNWASKSRATSVGKEGEKSNDDPAYQRAVQAAEMRLNLDQIRFSQATAELKRYQLMQHLISIKHRRNFELGENTLAGIQGMRAYYLHSADIISGVIPKLHRIQKKQGDLQDTHDDNIEPTWKERQLVLSDTRDNIHDAVLASNRNLENVVENIAEACEMTYPSKKEDIEDAAKFWSLPRTLALNTQYQRPQLQGVLLEGWLYKRSNAMISLNPWARRWFVMDKDMIYYYRGENEMRRNDRGAALSLRVKVCDVVLCTVRELSPEDANGLRFCFELVTPSVKPLMLQARGPTEYRLWVDGIKASMENQLYHGDPHSVELNKNIGTDNKRPEGPVVSRQSSRATDDEGDGDVYRDPSDNETEHSDVESKNSSPETVKEILVANPYCADCGMQSPDWASLNLGVLICMECSGVHRSLGVHVSKVRSLRLDALTTFEGQLLLSLGNERVNPIWEAGLSLQKGWEKPNEDADRKTREDWIKSKYAWRGFLHYEDSDGENQEARIEHYSRELYYAAAQGNVMKVADALAHDGKVDWVNEDDSSKTALHACALVKKDGDDWKAMECAELLLQNGAKLDAMDAAQHGVLDCALLGGADVKMVEYLTSKKV